MNKKILYEIKYFFNDELLLTLNYDDFKIKVMDIIWSEEKIEKFCQFSIISSEKMNIEIRKFNKIIIGLIILLLSSLSFNIYYCLKKKKKIKEI